LKIFVDLSSLEVIKKEKERISVKLKGIPLQYANALRRICLNGVPVFAIDTVDIIENSSVLADEGIAHRLALIPLKTDLTRFVEPSKCECKSENGCSNCRVMLVLDSESTDATKTIFSNELTSEDESIKPVSDNIPIVQLVPGQRLKIEAYARLGRGSEHAKWSSSNISVLTESDKDDEHILTIESTGALSPENIILAAVNELSERLGEFKDVLKNLKIE
jgi:DNA-directed RNA polymerase subunit D